MITTSKYGYSVGDIVTSKITLEDEYDNIVPSGSLLRIVAIAPKVRMSSIEDNLHDTKEYFYNAVLASNTSDYPRIRANFCTIRKVRKTDHNL